ncbi:filament-like plant protein 7 [Panicum miliaceum]|uniref:Filament-like plant protein 7 n=1 Tax=Panicum miliaceum TaxID=4540 RepID=A0A3L6TGH8_PANMI|nr:filament-like plant protein 7 [Panicum miliaceum]
MNLLDDFAEIEKMEMASGDLNGNAPLASLKKADPAVSGTIPKGHPERVHDIWNLVVHKHEASGESIKPFLMRFRRQSLTIEKIQSYHMTGLKLRRLRLEHLVQVCHDRLHGYAPKSIAEYASGAAKVVLTHTLAVVKSYFPGMDVSLFAEGVSEECTEERFNEYRAEVQDVAHQIVDDLPLF